MRDISSPSPHPVSLILFFCTADVPYNQKLLEILPLKKYLKYLIKCKLKTVIKLKNKHCHYIHLMYHIYILNKSSIFIGSNSIGCELFNGFLEPKSLLWCLSLLVLLCIEPGPILKVSVHLDRHCFIVINLSVSLIVYQCVSPT